MTPAATASRALRNCKSLALTKQLIVLVTNAGVICWSAHHDNCDSVAVWVAPVVHVDRKILDAVDHARRALELVHRACLKAVECQRILPEGTTIAVVVMDFELN